MGNKQEEKIRNFPPKKIKKLAKRFKRLDRDKNNVLTIDEFFAIPEFNENPLKYQILKLFDPDSEDPDLIQVDFTKFIQTITTMVLGTEEEKLHFLFRILDLDGDGFIDQNELFELLYSIIGDQVSSEVLHEICQNMIKEFDLARNDVISFEEFQILMKNEKISKQIQIHV
ncbi:protein phosphatase 3 regulatory subunit b alpha isoform type 1 [Anaeramoeba ignava]|uniref:Protein phosphatase 3 regulatory subunit b alpha isoform type 1 n=1 Tax=Anaeramoeba ignava TaxID=1746090 RepID=A0A9Q0LB11_ANAIG|nr:protein phosphatase 3 regulatory subunit b alpha isoform type 1 [Anaeramoeba ignava]